MATLEEFLRTGKLGPIHPGMSQAKTIECLGPPQDESVAREPKILKYDGVQLTFTRRQRDMEPTLTLIALYFSPHAGAIAVSLRPTDFPSPDEATIAGFREFLGRIGLKELAMVEGEDSTSLIMPSGARITFDGPQLHSIMFTMRSSTLSRKQISVAIPEDAWQQLNTLARQSHRSVSELCAQWITERVNDQPDHSGASGDQR